MAPAKDSMRDELVAGFINVLAKQVRAMPTVLRKGSVRNRFAHYRFAVSFILGATVDVEKMPLPPAIVAHFSPLGQLLELTQKQRLTVMVQPFLVVDSVQ